MYGLNWVYKLIRVGLGLNHSGVQKLDCPINPINPTQPVRLELSYKLIRVELGLNHSGIQKPDYPKIPDQPSSIRTF